MDNNFSSQNFWLNIDKPVSYSSAKVVAIVKRITKAKKVGHAGTLDPFASGVLPIAVNKATKTVEYIVGASKKYYCEITWGQFRDSDDLTGKVIEESEKRPTTLEIINILPKFLGQISQVPSSFSAIKINGQKSYELARKGEAVELKPRLIHISKIKLISNNNEKASLEIDCSKGTYIRSFAKDLAKHLGACGYVSVLKRLQVGNFLMSQTISLAKLKNIVNYNAPNSFLLRLRDVLNYVGIPEVELEKFDVLKIKNGQIIKCNYNIPQPTSSNSEMKLMVKIISNGELIALASLENGFLKPINVF